MKSRRVRTVLLDLDGTLVDSATGITEHLSSAMVVMVGDRLHDEHGAAAHDLATIGVSWGYVEPDELGHAGAIAVAETPEELGDLLVQEFQCAGPPA